MEEEVNQTKNTHQQEIVPSQKNKKFLIPFLFVVILILLTSTGFFAYLYFRELSGTLSKNQQLAPANTVSAEKELSSIEETSLEHAIIDGKLVVKFGDKVFIDEKNKAEPINSSDYIPAKEPQWETETLKFLQSDIVKTSIFDIEQMPNSKGFLAVIEAHVQITKNPVSDLDSRHIFWFNPNQPDNLIYPLISFSNDHPNSGYTFPVISEVSEDGSIVVLDLYGCWGCGGHMPSKYIFKTQLNEDYSRTQFEVGVTKEFQLNSDNTYTYVPYPKECLISFDPGAEPGANEKCLKEYSVAQITKEI